MNLWKKLVFIMLVTLFATLLPTLAQNTAHPSVIVDGQIVVDNTIRITEVVAEGNGFIVIHSADENGSFGDVIGHAPVGHGINVNVVVEIDTSAATDTLFAMLHTDDNTLGEYEFGIIDGADSPVVYDEGIVAPTLNVQVLSANDQFVDEGLVVIDSVTLSADGFVVVHADNGEGAPGDVIGVSPVIAGTSTNVVVELSGEPTDILFPMLHFDTDVAGEYEFGTVDGADLPVSIDGAVATMPIWTVPHMRIPDQALASGEINLATDLIVTAKSVLSDGPGFVVIHADNGGQSGDVIGFAAVEDGLTSDLSIPIDGILTAIVYPMLHSDTGTIGEYEFGTVEDADLPVSINEAVVVFPIDVAASITYAGILQDNLLTVEKAVIDQGGWLVIHANNGDGGPGDVIGAARLHSGVNFDITVALDKEMMTDTLFPMLHYDTSEIGAYEFGTVDDADLPVTVDNQVVVGALEPRIIE